MKKVRLKPTATFEPRPRPNQMMNSGASAMRGIAFSAVKIGLNTASVDGARDEQHADQHACDTAEHEGDHGAAHRPVEVVQQALGDEHLLPKILHDAGRLADQDRVDQFRVGRPLPEDEEHGKKHQPRRPDLSRSPHAFVGHWLNPSSSLLHTWE